MIGLATPVRLWGKFCSSRVTFSEPPEIVFSPEMQYLGTNWKYIFYQNLKIISKWQKSRKYISKFRKIKKMTKILHLTGRKSVWRNIFDSSIFWATSDYVVSSEKTAARALSWKRAGYSQKNDTWWTLTGVAPHMTSYDANLETLGSLFWIS